MKLLNGKELVGYIKERQAKQVRGLRQAEKIIPKLAIISTHDNPVSDLYMKLKKQYGEDILVDVDIYRIKQSETLDLIKNLNNDASVHGIIVQLPLKEPSQQREILNAVIKEKDVDGLSEDSKFDPATPIAINWLLAGYNINLDGKEILIIGRGPLVGAPLARIWKDSGYQVQTADIGTEDISLMIKNADIVVSATGAPGLIKSQELKQSAVVVDAGVAVANGQVFGDLDPNVYEREDIVVTPKKGGVGPLTVSALFDNVIRSARDSISS